MKFLHNRFAGRRHHILGLVAVFLVFTMIVSVVVFAFKQNPSKTAFAGNYDASEVIDAVNQERVKNNLPALKTNPKLMEASRNKVDDMIANGYFAHISPVDGKKWSSFIRNAGYDYIEAGENLANGFDNVPDLVTAWMNSPTHRDNILNPNVDETGLAVRSGYLDGYPTIFVAQSFGKRDVPALPSTPKADKTESNTVKTTEPAKNIPAESNRPQEVKKNESSSQVESTPKKDKIDKSKKVGESIKWEDVLNIFTQKLFE
jgi:uncharacterized protein YkwD